MDRAWLSGRRVSIAYLASALLLLGLGNLWFAVATGTPFPHFSPWKVDQYAFSYQELGFAKRALVGTLLEALGVAPWSAAARAAMLAVALAAALALARVAWRQADPVLAFALLASPASFLNMGFDLGRLDQLNLLLLLAMLFGRGRGWILLAPVMVLAHEGAVVMFLPLAFYCRWVTHGADRMLLLAAGLSLAVLLGLMTAGRHDAAELLRLYPRAEAESVRILTRSIGENMAFVREHLAGTEALLFLGYAAGLFYWLVVLGLVWRPVAALPRAALGLAAASAPLALSLVGIDIARWTALAVVNLFLLALVARRQGAPAPEPPGPPLLLLLVLYAAAGPIGIVFAFEGALEAWAR